MMYSMEYLMSVLDSCICVRMNLQYLLSKWQFQHTTNLGYYSWFHYDIINLSYNTYTISSWLYHNYIISKSWVLSLFIKHINVKIISKMGILHSMVTYKIEPLTVLLIYNSILFHTTRCTYHIQYLNYQKYNYHAHITVYTPL